MVKGGGGAAAGFISAVIDKIKDFLNLNEEAEPEPDARPEIDEGNVPADVNLKTTRKGRGRFEREQ
ncbi:hypothetical protein J4E05_16600 [Thalassospira sp. NFXS8]|uniref:hypothetical protein n=1 Tax=Thalassospira sp. NFXS8 TaxID=2819093 RepID=UPI0032DF767C